jgi:hypothetical protein
MSVTRSDLGPGSRARPHSLAGAEAKKKEGSV